MTVTHTNRKGQTYCLHQGITKSGKPKYFFALRDQGNLVETVPQGYEIYENPNSQVFPRKIRPQIITYEEIASVKAGMRQYSRLEPLHSRRQKGYYHHLHARSGCRFIRWYV